MDNYKRLERIKILFTQLKKGFLWMEAHPIDTEGNQAMIERARDKFIPELESLGVREIFTMALLVNGPNINWDIVKQFKK